MKQDDKITRKDFLKTGGSTALFAFLGIGFYGCTNRVTDSENVIDTDIDEDAIQVNGNRVILNLDHPDLEDMNNAGGWRLITSASVLAVNVDGDTIRAFTSVCTHAQCDTNWDFRDNEFICGCHLSKFNTNGEVTKGPATADLQEFDVDVNQNIVTISK
jgi:Rieske Fe-S protein